MNQPSKFQKVDNSKKVAVPKYESDTCEHAFKFAHAAHHGHWDMYKCEKCGLQKIVDH